MYVDSFVQDLEASMKESRVISEKEATAVGSETPSEASQTLCHRAFYHFIAYLSSPTTLLTFKSGLVSSSSRQQRIVKAKRRGKRKRKS